MRRGYGREAGCVVGVPAGTSRRRAAAITSALTNVTPGRRGASTSSTKVDLSAPFAPTTRSRRTGALLERAGGPVRVVARQRAVLVQRDCPDRWFAISSSAASATVAVAHPGVDWAVADRQDSSLDGYAPHTHLGSTTHQVWTVQVSNRGSILVADGRVIFSSGGGLFAVDLRTGTPLWGPVPVQSHMQGPDPVYRRRERGLHLRRAGVRRPRRRWPSDHLRPNPPAPCSVRSTPG